MLTMCLCLQCARSQSMTDCIYERKKFSELITSVAVTQNSEYTQVFTSNLRIIKCINTNYITNEKY